MKIKILAAVIFSFISLEGITQSYKYIYYLDENLSSVTKEKASIIGKGYDNNGNLILDCFLKTTGKKIISATVKDSTLSTLQGMFTTYYDGMSLESAGNYVENDMEGVWKYWDKDGFLTDSMIYKNGVRIAYGSYRYYFSKPTTLNQLFFPDSLKDASYFYTYSYTDSLKNTLHEKEISVKKGKSKINFEVDFTGNRGLLKEYDSTGAVKTDSVFNRNLREAAFPGGEDAWRNFLKTTLNANVPADHNAPSGKYLVIVRFIVNRDGTLDDIKVENDPGYGTAAEAIRVIKRSARWEPAIQYGNYRRAYRRQPITFFIEN